MAEPASVLIYTADKSHPMWQFLDFAISEGGRGRCLNGDKCPLNDSKEEGCATTFAHAVNLTDDEFREPTANAALLKFETDGMKLGPFPFKFPDTPAWLNHLREHGRHCRLRVQHFVRPQDGLIRVIINEDIHK